MARDFLETEVRTLFHQEDYKSLENIANEYRTTKTRFPDGGWKLYAFYKAFSTPYYGWDETFKNLTAWSKAFPNSMTARVAAAEAWLAFAWEARGTGYANTVTEEGWKLTRERVAKAYELIRKSPDHSAKDCIHRYFDLLRIARAQGWDRAEYEALFKKAISLEPSYNSYYVEKATYLLPRWHGKDGDWQKFADEAVKLTPASEGMTMYVWILINIWLDDEFSDFNKAYISWKKMKQGFLDIEKNYPNSPFMLNYFCMFACIAGDKKTASELFKRIDDEPYGEVWNGRSYYEKCRRWAINNK